LDKNNEIIFFEAVYNSLISEDKELSSLFQNNSPLYYNQHNGITCLYETTIVYLVFKELMRNKFPLAVSWEHPYPDNYALKADMALMNADKIEAFVEFKIWTTEDGREIRSDINKYLNFHSDISKYLCVIEYAGGDMNDNKDYLLSNNPEIQLVNMRQSTTNFYNYTHKKLEERSVFIYLFKMMN
jgi:hypothetical protein